MALSSYLHHECLWFCLSLSFSVSFYLSVSLVDFSTSTLLYCVLLVFFSVFSLYSTSRAHQIWNLTTQPPTLKDVVPTSGRVRHIEVVGETVMWSVDEAISPEQPELTVGTVYLLNNADKSSIPIHVSSFLFALLSSIFCVSNLSVICLLVTALTDHALYPPHG